MPAHPRSRGENERRESVKPIRFGSSPLTRGKHCSTGWGWGPRRLIPAHAGKTSRSPAPATSCAAHPRSRGENLKDAGRLVIGGGSSPLTRGKPRGTPPRPHQARLIPAHAGKTGWTPGRACHPPAHPRSRGENRRATTIGSQRGGSSPLTRGKLVNLRQHKHCRRLIPAHAGKTRGCASLRGLFRAHPRSRGENFQPAHTIGVFQGSSPLTRGKRARTLDCALLGGLIPAHAGKTGSRARRA